MKTMRSCYKWIDSLGFFPHLQNWNFSNKVQLNTVHIKTLWHLIESQYIDNQMAFFT